MKLLFIPGSGAGPQVWVYQTRYFKDSEGVALPGHPDGQASPSIDGYVEWLHGYIRAKQYQDVVLVGHSMGGAIALLYALKYGQELKGLVLIGTGARLRVRPDILEAVKQMIGKESVWRKYVIAGNLWTEPEVGQASNDERIRIGPAVLLNDFLACDRFDIMNQVQDVKVPTLIICGTEDEMTPVKYARYLTGKITGAKEVIIDGATHSVPREKPAEVNRAIADFLATLG